MGWNQPPPNMFFAMAFWRICFYWLWTPEDSTGPISCPLPVIPFQIGRWNQWSIRNRAFWRWEMDAEKLEVSVHQSNYTQYLQYTYMLLYSDMCILVCMFHFSIQTIWKQYLFGISNAYQCICFKICLYFVYSSDTYFLHVHYTKNIMFVLSVWNMTPLIDLTSQGCFFGEIRALQWHILTHWIHLGNIYLHFSLNLASFHLM